MFTPMQRFRTDRKPLNKARRPLKKKRPPRVIDGTAEEGFHDMPASPEGEVTRVRLPRGTQVIGICERRLGGSRMKVICLDGKTRVCRIPGRLKRTLWVRDGDTLLIEPWEFSGDGKGDVIYKYRPLQVDYLKKNGFLKGLEDLNEF